MDELDKKIKKVFTKKMKHSKKYDDMIQDTMAMIKNGEIKKDNSKVVDFKIRKKSKTLKYFQSVAAILVIGILGVTTYAGVTGKLNFRLNNTGYKKMEENYSEVATLIDQKFENEYFTITLESMAADPAYLIFEYDLKISDKGMKEIGEVPYKEFDGYQLFMDREIIINSEKYDDINLYYLSPTEKVSDNEYRIVDIINIANIKDNNLNVIEKINNIWIGEYTDRKLDVDIGGQVTADVKFNSNERKVLAEEKLSNGSTLYIEEVANTKFENYVLARIITRPQVRSQMMDRTNEFMIEDPQFAICDQNDNVINYESNRLEDYYERVLPDGTIEVDDWENAEDTDLVRMQQVQLLRLAFPDNEMPQKLKILPINRKLYSDKNNSEYQFYMNEDWYEIEIEDTNIKEDSTIGGSVTITKIEENEDYIIFYYDKQGYVPYYIDFVLRVKDSSMNYWYPVYEKYKGFESDENKIIYSKDIGEFSAGMPLLNYEKIDNIEELEFAIFYNVKFDVLAEPLEFEWSTTENGQTAVIENVKFDKYVTDVNEEIENYNEDLLIIE